MALHSPLDKSTLGRRERAACESRPDELAQLRCENARQAELLRRIGAVLRNSRITETKRVRYLGAFKVIDHARSLEPHAEWVRVSLHDIADVAGVVGKPRDETEEERKRVWALARKVAGQVLIELEERGLIERTHAYERSGGEIIASVVLVRYTGRLTDALSAVAELDEERPARAPRGLPPCPSCGTRHRIVERQTTAHEFYCQECNTKWSEPTRSRVLDHSDSAEFQNLETENAGKSPCLQNLEAGE